MKKTATLFALMSLFSTLSLASGVVIDNDENDCVNGFISMDVVVRVDSESFRFNPSCRFSFDDTFKTSRGVKCKISAGMCTSFSPKEKIEVSCSDGGNDSVKVKCPEL